MYLFIDYILPEQGENRLILVTKETTLNLVVVAGYGPVEIPPVYAFRTVKAQP